MEVAFGARETILSFVGLRAKFISQQNSLRRIDFGIPAEHVIANLAVDDLNQKTIDGAAASGDLLEHGGALLVLLESGANALYLAFDAVNADQQVATFLDGVSHG